MKVAAVTLLMLWLCTVAWSKTNFVLFERKNGRCSDGAISRRECFAIGRKEGQMHSHTNSPNHPKGCYRQSGDKTIGFNAGISTMECTAEKMCMCYMEIVERKSGRCGDRHILKQEECQAIAKSRGITMQKHDIPNQYPQGCHHLVEKNIMLFSSATSTAECTAERVCMCHGDDCVHEGVDTTGALVKLISGISEGAKCAKLCEETPECDVWTLTLSNFRHSWNRNKCYLKKNGVVKKAYGIYGDKNDDVISGKRCDKNDCVHEGVYTTGALVKLISGINEGAKCAKLCEETPECDVWTLTLSNFWLIPNRNKCYLKKNGVVKKHDSKNEGVISGKRCAKTSSLRAPFVVKEGDCWHKCGRKHGPCDYCGQGNYCCKKSEPGCEDEPGLKNTAAGGSRCVGWKEIAVNKNEACNNYLVITEEACRTMAMDRDYSMGVLGDFYSNKIFPAACYLDVETSTFYFNLYFTWRECTAERACMCLKEVNECADAKLNNCHSNAICTDTVRSYNCACKPGYEGNGVSCTRVGCFKAGPAKSTGFGCWKQCGNHGGKCNACGAGGYCCRKGFKDCPSVFVAAAHGRHHSCVKCTHGNSSLRNLKYLNLLTALHLAIVHLYTHF